MSLADKIVREYPDFITLSYNQAILESSGDDDYQFFLQWLFNKRQIGERDFEHEEVYFLLRKEGLFDPYRIKWDKFNAAKVKGNDFVVDFLKAPEIQGSSQDHIEWANRIRLGFILEANSFFYPRLFTDTILLKSLGTASFWIDHRKCSLDQLVDLLFKLADAYIDWVVADEVLDKKKKELLLLNFLYSL